MKRLHVDMDGITDNFNKAFLRKYNQRAKKPADQADIEVWDMFKVLPDKEALEWAMACMGTNGWWRGLDLMSPEVPEILKGWNKKAEVYLLTSPWNALSCKEKMERMEDHFPFLGRKQIIICSPKYLVTGDLLIDDKPRNLAKYQKHNPEAKLATIMYPHHHHIEPPLGTFFAHDYADGLNAWRELDTFVNEDVL